MNRSIVDFALGFAAVRNERYADVAEANHVPAMSCREMLHKKSRKFRMWFLL